MEPKIRLKGFSDEWTMRKLGSFGSVAMCKRVFKDQTSPIGDVPFYKIGTFGSSPDAYISRELFLDYKSRFSFPLKGDILISAAGTIGRVVEYLGEDAYFQDSNIVWLNHNDEIENLFLKYLYTIIKWKGLEGATIKRLYNNIILDTEIYNPSKEEQIKIGEYFQHLDSLIQATAKKIESLKQVKAASLQSMFPQEGETAPRVRFKGFEGDWEKMLVGKMGTTYSGIAGKTKDDFGHGEARFITFLNVLTNARIDTSILEPVNICNGEKQNEVKKGDLLFNTSSETPEEVGMCATMAESIENVYLNSFCFGFRVTEENIDSTFIAYLMRSHIGRKIMSILAQGATRYNLSKNSFCKAELLIPKTRKEQKAIAEYFTNLDEQITLQTQRLEKLKQIKSASLDNMFV